MTVHESKLCHLFEAGTNEIVNSIEFIDGSMEKLLNGLEGLFTESISINCVEFFLYSIAFRILFRGRRRNLAVVSHI